MKADGMAEASSAEVKSNKSTGGRAGSSEAGYVLLAVIFMVALLVLSLAIAAPKVTAAIQRDRELELVHRGEQYKRAIRLYYKKFGNYPSSIDQLEKTNNIRFLRKRYLDPLTGKDDWKMILVGQAHVCPLGFFGQPLGSGQALAGATPIASMPNSTLGAGIGGNTSFGGSSSGFGSSSSGSGFGSSSSTDTSGGTGTNTGTGCGTTGTGAVGLNGPGGDSSGSGLSGSGGFGGSSGGSTGGFGAGTSTSTTLGGGSSNSNGFGAATSTTLGGAPIMGVEPPLSKATILQYKLKTKYNVWEFAYWPAEDLAGAGGSLLGGSGSINGTGNSVNGPGGSGTSGFGSSSGAGGFGSNSGTSGFGSGTGSGAGTGSGNSGQSPQ